MPDPAVASEPASAVVTRLMAGYGSGDRAAVTAALAPTATIEQPAGLPHAGTYVGPDGFWDMVAKLTAAVRPKATAMAVHDLTPELAMTRMEVTFTAPGGAAVATPVAELFWVEGGQIVRIEPYYQRAIELGALGS